LSVGHPIFFLFATSKPMDYIPPSLKFAAGKLAFSRSRFRLETQGATTVAPGNTLTIVCPENAILDLKSWRLMARVTTTKNGNQ